jgi:hypothetical protein
MSSHTVNSPALCKQQQQTSATAPVNNSNQPALQVGACSGDNVVCHRWLTQLS